VNFAPIGSFAATTSVLVLASCAVGTTVYNFGYANTYNGIYKFTFPVAAGHVYNAALFTATNAVSVTATYNGVTKTGTALNGYIGFGSGSASPTKQYYGDQALVTVAANTVEIYAHRISCSTSAAGTHAGYASYHVPRLSYVWALK
jgi:hypothetical protein